MNALSLDDIRLYGQSTVAVHIALPDLRAMQLARAETLWVDGLSRAKIAAAIGIPVTTLHGWINKDRARFQHRKGDLAPPRKTAVADETLRIAVEMWEGGSTQAAIGARFGVSKNIVRKWMDENRDLFHFRRARRNGDVPAAPAEIARRPQRLAEAKPARVEFIQGLFAPAASARPKRGEFTLLQLTDQTCRWPVNDDVRAMRFCGCRIQPGKIYCDPHRAQSSMPARAGRTSIRKGQ